MDRLTLEVDSQYDIPSTTANSSPAYSSAEDETQLTSDQCVSLELCAGSAKWSLTMQSHGFEATGIDHIKCPNRVGPTVVSDLTKQSGKAFVTSTIQSGKVSVVGMTPPCGTSSRAREKPIP